MNKRTLVVLPAAFCAALYGCGVTAPIPEPGERTLIDIDRRATSPTPAPAPAAAAPAAPTRTAWYRVPDGSVVEEANCNLGTQRVAPDPAWPGWSVQQVCRLFVVQAAPAPAVTAPAAPPPVAYPPPPTTAAPTGVIPIPPNCRRYVTYDDGPAYVIAGLPERDAHGRPLCVVKDRSFKGSCPGHEVRFDPSDKPGWQYHIVCPTWQPRPVVKKRRT